MKTTRRDLPAMNLLFHRAMELNGRDGYKVWSAIDQRVFLRDIDNGLQYKITYDGDVACIFSIQFDDSFIWRERDRNDAIYLHRIVVNPDYKGRKQFQHVLDWTIDFARSMKKAFIRMDTWAENTRLIDYYKSYGFQFVEYYVTPDAPELPLQNRNLHVALLELPLAADQQEAYERNAGAI